MYIVIEKNFDKNQLVTKQKCVKILSDSGFEISNSEELKFSENYNLSTDLGKNRLKVFKTLMKGQIQIDAMKPSIKWKLRIGGLVFKSLLIMTIITLMFPVLYAIEFMTSFFIGGIVGFSIFIYSRASLTFKVNTLTAKIIAHNNKYSA